MKKLKNNIYHNNGVYQFPFFWPVITSPQKRNIKRFQNHPASLITQEEFEKRLFESAENGFFVKLVNDEFWQLEIGEKLGLVWFDIPGGVCGFACPDGEIARLDAYQVLTHGTIDMQSTFFTDKERFTSIVGNEIVAAMEKILYEDQSVTRN